MVTHITITDSTSLGAVILYGLVSESGNSVDLVWSGKFLSSWKAVEIGGIRINNGYHVFELPRSENLVDSISRLTNLKPIVWDKKSFIYLHGNLIDSESAQVDWPIQLVNELGQPKDTASSEQMAQVIEKFLRPYGQRFAEEWESCRHLFVPWFFPTDLLAKESDEGGAFRYLSRRGEVRAQVAVFGDGTMAFLRSVLFKKIQAKAVSPHSLDLDETPADKVTREGVLELGDRAFTLALFRLPNGLPADLSQFDEILVADPRFQSLNRCWFFSVGNDFYVVGELYRTSLEELADAEISMLGELLGDMLSLSNLQGNFVGSQISRVLNPAKLQSNRMWENSFDVERREGNLTFTAVSLGTANMNKVYRKAEEAFSKLRAPEFRIPGGSETATSPFSTD